MCAGLAVVERLDQHRVLLGDEVAAHLAGAGQLAVVGVEFLVQHQEALICVRPVAGRGQVGG
jgi:hypothetical protein